VIIRATSQKLAIFILVALRTWHWSYTRSLHAVCADGADWSLHYRTPWSLPNEPRSSFRRHHHTFLSPPDVTVSTRHGPVCLITLLNTTVWQLFKSWHFLPHVPSQASIIAACVCVCGSKLQGLTSNVDILAEGGLLLAKIHLSKQILRLSEG
jgi:hypothetical protein